MKFLRTQYAALFGIILILLATVKHAYEVYISIMYVNTEPDLLATIYIITMLVAIDFAVLLFTIHGNTYAAQTFAFMIFLLNLFAFWHHLNWPGWETELFIYFPGLLFSAMFSYGLYYFTEVFSELLYVAKQKAETVEQDKAKNIELQALTAKAEQGELLLEYIINKEEYLDKSPEALRKGVEYWKKKKGEKALMIADAVKLLAYEQAYLMRSNVGG